MQTPKIVVTAAFFSALVMYGLNYFWHGIALNDLARIQYPLETYFMLAGAIYSVLGLVTAVLVQAVDFGRRNAIKGIMVGVPLGFLVFLIAFTFGISFYTSPSLVHVAIDAVWQITEQSVGGLTAGLVFQLMLRFQKRNFIQD